jgi:uncharacterized protein (DUF58 family)
MWKRRIAWIIIIITAALLYLFDNETITLALLLVCVLAPALSAAVLLMSSASISVSLEPGEITENGISFRTVIRNRKVMPLAEIELPVECVNLRTGQTDTVIINGSAAGRKDKVIDLDIDFYHTGRYELSAGNAVIMDPLRIWRKTVTIGEKACMTVLPDIFDMRMSVTSSSASILSTDQYSRLGKGIEPGEVRSIREYAPGDPIKNIHWKLSEKTDKLLVKELELPETGEILAVLDTFYDDVVEPDTLDAIASVYMSISQAFVNNDIGFYAAWTDPETSRPEIRHITCEQELFDAADKFLAVPAMYQSTIDTLETVLPESRYAHIIMTGSRIPYTLDSITNGSQVTLLLCGPESAVSASDGANIIGFNDFSYAADLAEIEV